VGSRAELSELTGEDHGELDPHRPYVDEVTVPCASCQATAHRVPDVADTWFDSGGMPYAQWGYPHAGARAVRAPLPGRLHLRGDRPDARLVLHAARRVHPAVRRSLLRTVVCLGHIVDEDGRKMSKSLGNILDPWELIERHGADPLRWLMFAEGNPWVSRRVGHHLLEDVVRQFLLTLWNTHVFFTTYARIDGFSLDDRAPAVADRPPPTDGCWPSWPRWWTRWTPRWTATTSRRRRARSRSSWTTCRTGTCAATGVASGSRWSEDPADKAAAYHTLHTCLVT
jgi:isoleucyl-tRNA synthetase